MRMCEATLTPCEACDPRFHAKEKRCLILSFQLGSEILTERLSVVGAWLSGGLRGNLKAYLSQMPTLPQKSEGGTRGVPVCPAPPSHPAGSVC